MSFSIRRRSSMSRDAGHGPLQPSTFAQRSSQLVLTRVLRPSLQRIVEAVTVPCLIEVASRRGSSECLQINFVSRRAPIQLLDRPIDRRLLAAGIDNNSRSTCWIGCVHHKGQSYPRGAIRVGADCFGSLWLQPATTRHDC
jgi:hypothetical protein